MKTKKKKRKRINVVGIKAFSTRGMSFRGCLGMNPITQADGTEQLTS